MSYDGCMSMLVLAFTALVWFIVGVLLGMWLL